MDYFDVVRERRSVRAYADEAVDPEALQTILQAATDAPSAGDLQAYEIFLVTDEVRRTTLARAAGDQEFVEQAPVVLVFCANPGRSSPRYGRRGADLYALQDATIACTYAQLAVTALGLASVWVGAFDDDAVRAVIGVGADLLPVAVLPIGHAAEEPAATPRRSLDDLVH